MKKLILHCIFLGSAAFLPVTGKRSSPPAPNAGFSASHNRFAFRLLDAVSQQDSSRKNLLISPLGVYLAMGILYNGADQATRDSIAEALHTVEFGAQNLNSLCKELVQGLSMQDEKAELILASSLWCNRKKSMSLPAFENICEQYYYAPVRTMSFSGPTAAGQMNRWVDQTTRHRIQTLVPAVSVKDPIYLANATLFRSDWTSPFDIGESREETFFLAGGSKETTHFMKKEFVAKAYSDTSFTMVELPVGNARGYSMLLILPDDPERPVRDFLQSFDASRLYEALPRMNDQWIQLSLPRWEYAYSPDDMGPALRQMGMGILMDDHGDADLSNLCGNGGQRRGPSINDLLAGRARPRSSHNVYLSKLIHTTCIKVNEKGLQAGSAQAVPAGNSPAFTRRHHAQVIRADHPFLFAIVSRPQQVVLFTGIVNDPGKGH